MVGRKLRVGSLFSGVGMFDLGLSWTGGFTTEWFCECNDYSRKILELRFPGIPIYDDIRSLRMPFPGVSVLCGSFPCQDISIAGKGAGIEGSRSSLWGEFARIIREARPRWVLVENVPALTFRGLGTVLGDLATSGYDAEWDCISASAFGAPHVRDRIWIIAYPSSLRIDGRDPQVGRGDSPWRVYNDGTRQASFAGTKGRIPWKAFPDFPTPSELQRMAYGVPHRMDRLGVIGDSLVPDIAQVLGERILECEYASAS